MNAKVGLIICALIGVAACLGPSPKQGDVTQQSNNHDVIRGSRFELVNSKGRPVASISALEQGWPGFSINSISPTTGLEESALTVISLPEGGTVISLGRGNKGPQVGIGVSNIGDAFVELNGLGMSGRTLFGVSKEGDPFIRLTDKNKKVHDLWAQP